GPVYTMPRTLGTHLTEGLLSKGYAVLWQLTPASRQHLFPHGLLDNVFVTESAVQYAVLLHPSIELFVTHGSSHALYD
ncbi:hypothetical protein OE165_28795, partial [Escherichia coli]|uniref:hypothetical protein n=1 Tax=Escherichia coli TaxID=562 RepID=UPI0021F25142